MRTGAQKGPQGGLRIEYDGASSNGAAQPAVRTVPIDLALLREHWTVKAQPSAAADPIAGAARPAPAPGLSATPQVSAVPGPIASSVGPPHHGASAALPKPPAPLGPSHIHPSRLCRSFSVQELPHTESLAAETCVRAGVAPGKTDGRVRLGRRSATSSVYGDRSSHGPGSSPAPFLMVSGEPMAVGTAPSALGPALSNASSPFTTGAKSSSMMGGSGGAQRWTQSARNLFAALPGLCEVGLSDGAESKQHGGRGREPIEKRVWGGRLLRSQSKEAGTMLSMLSMLDSMGALPLTPRSQLATSTPPNGPATGDATVAAGLSVGGAPATPPSASGRFPVSASFGGAQGGGGAGSSSALNIMELSRSSFGAAAVFGLNRLSSLDSCTLHQLDRALSSASLEAAAHAAAASVHAATVHAASAARAVQQAAASSHASSLANGNGNGHANGHANGVNGCAASPTVGSSSSSVGLAASTPTHGVSLSSLSLSNGLPAIHKVRPVGSVTSMSLSLPAAGGGGGGGLSGAAGGGGGGGPASGTTMTRQDSTLFEFAEEQSSLAAAAAAAAQVGGSVSGGYGYYSSGLSGLVGSFGCATSGASMYAHLTNTGNGHGGMATGGGTGGGAGGGLSGPNDFLVLLSANSSHIASVSASPNHHQPAVSLAALLATNRCSSGGAAVFTSSPGPATPGAAAAQYSFSTAAQLCGTPGAGAGPGSIRRFVDPSNAASGATAITSTTVVSPRAVADRAAAAAAVAARAAAASPAAAVPSSPATSSMGGYVPKIKTAAAPSVMAFSHAAPDMRAFAFSSPEDFFAAAAVLMDVRLPSAHSEAEAAGGAAAAAAAADADAAAGEDGRASASSSGTATLGTAATLTTEGSSNKGLFSAAGSSLSPTGGAPLAAEAAEADCGADA
ncbi:hypothetical protein HXX76_011107 [Chlamydomonas incerta]|uniref:Uncharacterized protein n=1 Tax=Chlamydomonas incerta TaxID=51695 RepID=A0A835VY51_CHLIN|nr:hypothetical protein HXX76_011107 [Chlamydomonas incerta]|eukprot:KAG2429341.1 hypothetical protein HXX76_011107 [Chlamydomonas incerta]